MTDAQLIASALDHLSVANELVQKACAGSKDRLHIYEMFMRLEITICEEAADLGIDMSPDAV